MGRFQLCSTASRFMTFVVCVAALQPNNASASDLKNWPLPVWALATVCDDQLNCEKRAVQVPDVILKQSNGISECTMYLSALSGGTHLDEEGNVTHTVVICAVGRHAPKGYKILAH